MYHAFLLTSPEPDQARIATQQLVNLREFDHARTTMVDAAAAAHLPRRRRQQDEEGTLEEVHPPRPANRGDKQGDEGR